MRNRRSEALPRLLLLAFVLPLGGAACVSTSTYQAAVADAKGAHEEVARKTRDLDELHARLDEAEKAAQARDETLAKLRTDGHNLQQSLDEATAMNQGLRSELSRLGKDVDKILAEKGSLSKQLVDAKTRLEELRKAQAAAEARAALFRSVLDRLKKLVDAGDLEIAMREGRLVLQLANDVLFDSGSAEVKAQGRATLEKLGAVLVTISGRKFQVAGHTDDVPIGNARFSSNWALSTARAVEVVKLLVVAGVKPQTLSAAGYGEFDTLVPNDGARGRAKNRRIEITLVPNLDELYSIPETK
jgi:chemotaxis protein MotB